MYYPFLDYFSFWAFPDPPPPPPQAQAAVNLNYEC